MIAVVIIVLLLWALWFFGPYIRRWLMRKGMNYMQDKMYQSMGIDPETVKRARKEAAKEAAQANHRQRRRGRRMGTPGKIIPREYGEYIDFEVLLITGAETWLQDTQASPAFTSYNSEQQITDVKFTVI